MELVDEVEAAAEPLPDHEDEESIAEATLIEPRSGPEAEERAYEEAIVGDAGDNSIAEGFPAPAGSLEPSDEMKAVAEASADWDAPPDTEAADEMFSPFAAPDEIESRPTRRPVLTLLAIALLVAAAAAGFWFLAPPELKARVGIGSGGASPLALVTTHMDRQQLESGNELLTVTGRVINPTSREQTVPPLRAQLRTRTGKVVYSWTIAPPARTLAAGASASFNSAEVNVPPGGDELTITLGSPRA